MSRPQRAGSGRPGFAATRPAPLYSRGFAPGSARPDRPRRATPTNPHLLPQPVPGCPSLKGSDTEAAGRPNPRTPPSPAPSSLEPDGGFPFDGVTAMPQVTMRQMLEAGVHFGHQTR